MGAMFGRWPLGLALAWPGHPEITIFSANSIGTRAAPVGRMRLHRQHIERRMGSMRSFPTSLRHVRPVQPRTFPSSDPEWEMPESMRHKLLCIQLYQLLRRLVGASSSVGSDQFIYFDGENPKRCLAPDAFLKAHVKQTIFDSWKTWEHGVPELAVEVLARDTTEYLTMNQKLARYRALGVRELVVFNFDARGKRLRVYDRVHDDLVERVVVRESTPCVALAELLGQRCDWTIAPADDLPAALRLMKGKRLVPTEAEQLIHVERDNDLLAREVARLKKKR
jgi:Uma2 family endonuclease